VIPTEDCPRCGTACLPHDMHEERVCGDCCNGCDNLAGTAEAVFEALVDLAGDEAHAKVEAAFKMTEEEVIVLRLQAVSAWLRTQGTRR